MMIGSENIATSAEKILQAATELFAMNNFNAVSIKQIASASGCNSALISYYFGGKKNLYQEVLNAQAVVFFKLIDEIRQMDMPPLSKLRHYVDALSKIQETNPESIPLICRELLSPQPLFEKFVKNKLYTSSSSAASEPSAARKTARRSSLSSQALTSREPALFLSASSLALWPSVRSSGFFTSA